MQIPQSEKITLEFTRILINWANQSGFIIDYNPSKHQLIFEKDSVWLGKVYLPWTVFWDEKSGLIENQDLHFSICLIKAGQACVGYFHGENLEDHKVFRAYMVRQKQGKSQIKHLKTKGKSRAGSRIRLEETERFFEEINERLTRYDNFPIGFWGISCSKTLWPHFFASDPPPPFSSSSKNLIELPFHVSKASFEEMQHAGKLVCQAHLLISEEGRSHFEKLDRATKKDEENW